MRFLIIRDADAPGANFQINADNGRPAYIVDGRTLALASRMEIQDISGQRIFTIKKKQAEGQDLFCVIDNEQDMMAQVSKQMIIKPDHMRINTEYGTFLIKGDLVGQDYGFFQKGEQIARLWRKPSLKGDCWILDVIDGETGELLAMVAGGESLDFEDSGDEDDFEAFLLALVMIMALMFGIIS